MLRRSSFARKRAASTASEDVNPMNYVSNLSDAMLVLAVGMMLALVVAWNVDISGVPSDYDEGGTQKEPVQFTDEMDELQTTTDKSEDSMTAEDFGLTEYGKVYIDEEGNYYVIEED